jgi:hypothetical protein
MDLAVTWHITVESSVSVLGQSMWDLWWIKWPWDRLFRVLPYSLSVQFHQCSTLIHLSPTLYNLTNGQRR